MVAIFSTGVSCAEEAGTRSESYEDEAGFSASVGLRCAWADRYGLIEDLIGKPWPYMTKAQCNRCGIVGFGEATVADGQAMVYEHAVITASYSTKVVDFISESLEPTVEFQIQDAKLFRWGNANGDPLLEAEAPGKLCYGLNLVRTLYRLPSLPGELLTDPGKVNPEDYISGILGLTFPAETLLFQPSNNNRAIRSDGSDGWTMQLKFNYKENGWNKFWRAKSQAWEKIFLAGGAEYKVYPLGDFAGLLF